MTAFASKLMSALSAHSASFGLPPKRSIRASQRLLKTQSDGNMTSARRYLALGYAYRFQHKIDKAIIAFHQARSLASEDMGPRGYYYALATWALADAHTHSRNITAAGKFYMDAVGLLVRSVGHGSQEVNACLEDFREFAEGVLKRRALVNEIDGMIKMAKISAC